jgi:serine/threonine protein phosphatase PrpC
VFDNKIICANVGDSRAILISKRTEEEVKSYKARMSSFSKSNSSKLKKNLKKIKIDEHLLKQWKVTQLSRDHKPELDDEKQRILKTGQGSVRRVKDDNGNPCGPYRVFDGYGLSGGLAMSRSIGDHALEKAGVIADPELTEHEITEQDKALIIASDGVWEFLSNEDILQLLHKICFDSNLISQERQPNFLHKLNMQRVNSANWNSNCNIKSKSLCKSIIKVSKYYWAESEKNMRDDITVIVVFFNEFCN